MTLEIAILVVCGIPASGKSTLVSRLVKSDSSSSMHRANAFVVSYDRLMPHELEVQLVGGDTVCRSRWKKYRGKIKFAVDGLLAEMTGSTSGQIDTETGIILDDIKNHSMRWCELAGDAQRVIIIDDNMYYRSMRYEYLQLAKKHSVGYCQVMKKCSLEVAIRRNRLRSHPVDEDVLRKMYSIFEEPSRANSWETHSLVADELDDTLIEEIAAMVGRAVKYPFSPTADLTAEKDIARKINLRAVTHQVDHILRNLVGKKTKEQKDKNKFNQAFYQELNMRRFQVLKDIKNGSTVLPEHLVDGILQGNVQIIATELSATLEEIMDGSLTRGTRDHQ